MNMTDFEKTMEHCARRRDLWSPFASQMNALETGKEAGIYWDGSTASEILYLLMRFRWQVLHRDPEPVLICPGRHMPDWPVPVVRTWTGMTMLPLCQDDLVALFLGRMFLEGRTVPYAPQDRKHGTAYPLFQVRLRSLKNAARALDLFWKAPAQQQSPEYVMGLEVIQKTQSDPKILWEHLVRSMENVHPETFPFHSRS